MASVNLPKLESIEPEPLAIRQHVRRLKRGEETEPIEARISYLLRSGTRKWMTCLFGKYAVFAGGDLAFEIKDGYGVANLNGILLAEGDDMYVSTPWSGNDHT